MRQYRLVQVSSVKLLVQLQVAESVSQWCRPAAAIHIRSEAKTRVSRMPALPCIGKSFVHMCRPPRRGRRPII